MKLTNRIAVAVLACAIAAPGVAQTASTARGTREVYGARLTPVGPNDAVINDRRAVKRLDTRIQSRLSTRIERYRVGNTDDPLAVQKAQTRDNTEALRERVQPIPQDQDER